MCWTAPLKPVRVGR